MNKRSNLSFRSNVYVVSGDFCSDKKFQSMVRGRKGLRKMLKVLSGLGWIEGSVSLDSYTFYLTNLQKMQWEAGMYCALLGDSQEIVWGTIKDGDEERVECRCYRLECPNFSSCRPGFVPGETPLAERPEYLQSGEMQPDAGPVDGSGGESVPIVVGEMPTEVFLGSGHTMDIEFEKEPDIPKLKIPAVERPEQESADSVKDEEAMKIVTAPAREKMLVLSGPGTGKTHSLLCRLEYLVKKGMVEANNILMLCYTRAAVREIRERLQSGTMQENHAVDFAGVEIRTFDSFATLVLVERDVNFTRADYDERIQMVVEEIRKDPVILQDVRHFMVDEIQDLVGPRACLVQVILQNLPNNCGFTLLGDPCQAIYNYSIRELPQEVTNEVFLEWLCSRFDGLLETRKLDVNRRQSGAIAVISASMRSVLEEGKHPEIRQFIRDLGQQLPVEKKVEQTNSHGSKQKKVAILCRSNGEVLKISGYLNKSEIPHILRRTHTRWLLPAWVARILDGHRQRIEKDDLVEAGVSDTDTVFGTDRIYELLKQETGAGEYGYVDVNRLRGTFASGRRLPDELYETPAATLYVSTIHQSKGREFDRVYLLLPEGLERFQEAEEIQEEGRVYYVALTRARDEILLLQRPQVYERAFTWLGRTPGKKRWVEQGKKNDGNRRLVGMEIGMAEDIDEESFVDDSLSLFSQDPAERQRYIANKINPGDPLKVSLLHEESSLYGLYHREQLIGMMSELFTSGVREAMNFVYFRSNYLPQGFSDVYAERIYSVVKKPETVSKNAGKHYLDTGVWYGVNPVGMAKVQFNSY